MRTIVRYVSWVEGREAAALGDTSAHAKRCQQARNSKETAHRINLAVVLLASALKRQTMCDEHVVLLSVLPEKASQMS